MIFEECAIRHCIAIGLVDNNMLEDDEVFELRLFRTSTLLERIHIYDSITQVTIKDDDCELTKRIFLNNP